jgi:hypothetical protein
MLRRVNDPIQHMVFMILFIHTEIIPLYFFLFFCEHYRKAHTWYLPSGQLFNIVKSKKKCMNNLVQHMIFMVLTYLCESYYFMWNFFLDTAKKNLYVTKYQVLLLNHTKKIKQHQKDRTCSIVIWFKKQ